MDKESIRDRMLSFVERIENLPPLEQQVEINRFCDQERSIPEAEGRELMSLLRGYLADEGAKVPSKQADASFDEKEVWSRIKELKDIDKMVLEYQRERQSHVKDHTLRRIDMYISPMLLQASLVCARSEQSLWLHDIVLKYYPFDLDIAIRVAKTAIREKQYDQALLVLDVCYEKSGELSQSSSAEYRVAITELRTMIEGNRSQ